MPGIIPGGIIPGIIIPGIGATPRAFLRALDMAVMTLLAYDYASRHTATTEDTVKTKRLQWHKHGGNLMFFHVFHFLHKIACFELF